MFSGSRWREGLSSGPAFPVHRGVLVQRRVLAMGALAVGLALAGFSILGAAAGPISFTTPVVLGYPPAGNDWEPAVASDGRGNVYYMTTHLSGIPDCNLCSADTMVMQVSRDGGRTFTAPSPLTISSAAQFDPQVKVNAAGVVFVSYLRGKDTVVQRSLVIARWDFTLLRVAGDFLSRQRSLQIRLTFGIEILVLG